MNKNNGPGMVANWLDLSIGESRRGPDAQHHHPRDASTPSLLDRMALNCTRQRHIMRNGGLGNVRIDDKQGLDLTTHLSRQTSVFLFLSGWNILHAGRHMGIDDLLRLDRFDNLRCLDMG